MSGSATFVQCLTSARAVGVLKNTFTTSQRIINDGDITPIFATYLFPGAQFEIELFAALSNIVTATPTFTFNVVLGGVVVFTTGALTTVATASVLLPLKMKIDLRLDTEGSGTSAKFLGHAWYECAALNPARGIAPATSPAVGTGFDSTAGSNLELQAACSASSASNGIQVYNYKVNQYRFGG